MQLAGPRVWGPPKDRGEAIAVLRAAVEAGVNHIDTADFYGPHVTNEIIREALAPYDGVHIITKVGSVRDENGGWPHARSPEQLREQVESNLHTLGVEALDVVNLRVGGGPDGHSPVPGSIAEPFGALAEMRQEGLIAQLGVANPRLVHTPRELLRGHVDIQPLKREKVVVHVCGSMPPTSEKTVTANNGIPRAARSWRGLFALGMEPQT